MNFSKIWSKISKSAEDDYFSLSENDRAIYNIKNLLDAVRGNGLLSFYESYSGDYSQDLLDDLYLVGMDEIAAVVESSNSIFPGGYPPEELELRLEIIDSWEHEYDPLYEQWTEDILEFSKELEDAWKNLFSEI